MQKLPILCLICLSIVVCIAGVCSAEKVDHQLDLLELRDCYGKTHKIGELRGDTKILVFAFLGTECPLAKLYGPKLQSLDERFHQAGVQVIGIFSNIQDSLTEVAAYGIQAGIHFPMLLDKDQQLADLVRANRTPEVVVLDASGTIQYRGRIDDQFGISVARKEPTREDLVAAIENIIDGRKPELAEVPSMGCVIGRNNRQEPHGDITYSKDIAAILNTRCVECHRPGEIAPFPLTSFAETVGWEATIAEVIGEQRMPPWNANPKFGHFKNDARLTEQEKRLIQTWIDNGCPEGDASDLPPPPTFATGWRMPDPDLVLHVRDEPFQVQATGVIDYQYFQVDPQFDEDKYVIAAEARPGNPAVVHHIIAYLLLPGSKDVSLGTMLIGYAPGTSPLIFAKDSAMRIPAGSKILFEVHYTPNGVAQVDRSYIGLKFTDGSQITNEVVGLEAINKNLKIPAGAAAHTVTAQKRFRDDLTLLSLTPHMHLRGKAFRYDARYPDGTEETLLDVPSYDFNWQLRYEFSEPKPIPKGTVVTCTAVYDNSAGNPNNPDPSRQIHWGQQSWDEMMIGFFTGVRPIQDHAQ